MDARVSRQGPGNLKPPPARRMGSGGPMTTTTC